MALRRSGDERSRWGEGGALRDQIITAARALLEREGEEAAVTLRGVAREVGIAAPSIYPHFRNHDQLIAGLIESLAEDFEARTTQVTSSPGAEASPRDLLRASHLAYLAFAREVPAGYQLLFARPSTAHRVPLAEARQPALDSFERMLELYGRAVSGMSPEEVRARATLMWATLHGLAELPTHNPAFPWPDQEVMVDAMLDLFLA